MVVPIAHSPRRARVAAEVVNLTRPGGRAGAVEANARYPLLASPDICDSVDFAVQLG